MLRKHIAVDLGTANTLVFVQSQGIVINEPSVVAVDTINERVIAVGKEAKDYIGKTPQRISTIRPLRDGVIADFDAAQALIATFLKKVIGSWPIKPDVVICVPTNITDVERRAVAEAATKAGARNVKLIEEPVAAAVGAGLPVLDPVGSMVVDIGGGTSNIAVYEKGVLRGTCCLDIGGRLIKVENGRISYIFPKIQALAAANGISLAVGDRAYPEQLYGVCRLMAAQLAQALRLAGADSHHAGLYTNNGKPLPEQPAIRAVTYSGGVADCIYQEMEGDVFRFGDIGVLLGKAIRADPDLSRVERFTSIETIRATVVGAGTHTTEVSGSTIHYEQGTLPLKNVPILKVSEEDEASLETLKASILNQMPLYMPEGKAEQLAIAFTGEKRTSFADIQALAAAIIESTKEVISSRYPLVVVVENDIGKVLGNALNVLLKREKDVICIDGIRTLSGDYIDIGEPIAGGQVLPVVIKTLIFNS